MRVKQLVTRTLNLTRVFWVHAVELLEVVSGPALLPGRHDAVVRVPAEHQQAWDPVRSKLYMTKKWMATLPRETNGVKRLQKSASLARWLSGCRRT